MMMDDGRMIGELLERKKRLSTKVFEIVSCSDIPFLFSFFPPEWLRLQFIFTFQQSNKVSAVK